MPRRAQALGLLAMSAKPVDSSLSMTQYLMEPSCQAQLLILDPAINSRSACLMSASGSQPQRSLGNPGNVNKRTDNVHC